jgi:hypothetical protein
MIIDHILARVREQHLILTEEGLIWMLPGAIPQPLTALELAYHTEEVKQLMAEGDWRICPTQDAHRKYSKYVGNDKYICEKCRQTWESIHGERL